MKKLLLNSQAKILIKIDSKIGSFVQRIKVENLYILKNNFGISLEVSILTLSDGKYKWIKLEDHYKDSMVQMHALSMFHGGYWIQVPAHFGKKINIFTGVEDEFPYTCENVCDYLYLISQYICNHDKKYNIVYNTNVAKNIFEYNFSKHQVTRFYEKKNIKGFDFYNTNMRYEYYFDYENFDKKYFLSILFEDIGNMPLEFLTEIKLFNSGFLSQFALMNHNNVKSDFIIPDLLWIYLLMYKKEVDLHIPHSDDMWKSLMRNQKVSQLSLAYQKKNLVTMKDLQDGYIICIDSDNSVLVNEGYFFIEVK